MVSIWILVGSTAGSSNDMIVNGSTRATAISNHPSLSLSFRISRATVRPSLVAAGDHCHGASSSLPPPPAPEGEGRRTWPAAMGLLQRCIAALLVVVLDHFAAAKFVSSN
jgi:hypothetical protein